jgi:hypothetical protein
MKTHTLLALICLSLLTSSLFGQTNAPADSTNAVSTLNTTNFVALQANAEAQAKAGDIAGALKTADLLQDEGLNQDWKSSTLQAIAVGQANTNDISGALKTADLLQDLDTNRLWKSYAIQTIAEAQAKSGDIAGAQKTADLIQNTGYKGNAQNAIAQAQLKAGDFTGALKTADLQQDTDSTHLWKSYTQETIAEAQAKAGDIADAQKTADLIQDASLKSSALQAIYPLQGLVAKYQQPPNSWVDAENVAKQAATMDTLPTVPPEARRHLVMGQTIFKAATSTNDFQQAYWEFYQASTNAPWVANIWFNMALAAEAEGRYDLATNCLQVYQDFKLSDTDAQEAQDKIYEIQAKQQLAAKHAADEQQAAADAIKAKQQSFVGKWFQVYSDHTDQNQFIEIIDSSSAQLSDGFGMSNNGQCAITGNASITDLQISGQNVKFTIKLIEDRNWTTGFHQSWNENDYYNLTISEDGTKLTGKYVPYITSNGQDLNPNQNSSDCKFSKRD